MIKKEILRQIVELQKKTNDIAKKDWLENPPNYLRAAKMETIEAIDHLCSWKWWKANKPDYHNAAMEMVDAFHFIISEELVRFDGDIDCVAELLSCYFSMPIEYDKIESMQPEEANALLDTMAMDFTLGNIHYQRFFIACVFLGLNQEQLIDWYCGKNALNNFRQANGYKTGEYVKNWFGNEDNDYLIEIINSLSLEQQKDSYTSIYNALGETYKKAVEHENSKH